MPNNLDEFFSNCRITSDYSVFTPKRILWHTYTKWANAEDVQKVTKKVFYQHAERLGCLFMRKRVDGENLNVVLGIKIDEMNIKVQTVKPARKKSKLRHFTVDRENLDSLLVSLEQLRNEIRPDNMVKAIYESEMAIAELRNILGEETNWPEEVVWSYGEYRTVSDQRRISEEKEAEKEPKKEKEDEKPDLPLPNLSMGPIPSDTPF